MINYKIFFIIIIIFSCLIFEYKQIFFLLNKKWSFQLSKILKKNRNQLNNADKIPVITYHFILSDFEKSFTNNYDQTLSVSKRTFIKQMKWLYKRGYKTLDCEELYLWHQKKIELPKKSLLITFDGGSIGQEKYAMPILKKYNMKGVTFILGIDSCKNRQGKIKYNKIPKLKKLYPNFDFQSHTYNLHKKLTKNDYNLTMKDAFIQKNYFNFSFLAYPYGYYTPGMIKAYIKSGIRMAFTYGKNDYASRNQNIYKIKRIKVNGKENFTSFTRWFKN